ncbi:hypothetical protein ACFVVA_37120 [Kitasatospora sp. NPDC058048]|uniref:hypothetical protein n=1 Tax=Kitasatospora sp. NPDC058048 TaxID=3346313 RepID=UPI0036DE3E9F
MDDLLGSTSLLPARPGHRYVNALALLLDVGRLFTPAPVFGSAPVGTAAAGGRTPAGAPFGAVPVGVPTPPRPRRPPVPPAAPPESRPPVAAGPIRRRAGLLSLAPVLAVPLVLLVAAEAGELDRPDVPVLQSAADPWRPLVVAPASASAPSATPSSTVTTVAAPAPPAPSPAADPTTDPAAAGGDASEPDAEAAPSTPGSPSKRPPAARPTRPSAGGARPPAAPPAQPAPGSPVVPLPGVGTGELCAAARQSGQLPPNLLQLCHSMFGNM